MTINEQAVNVGIRWRDLDHLGHIFHGEYLTILDEARTQWLEKIIGEQSADSHVIARIEVDFKSPLTRRDKSIDLNFQVTRVGNTSITLREILSSHISGVAAAETNTTIVMWDMENSVSRALTAEERSILTDQMNNTVPTTNEEPNDD